MKNTAQKTKLLTLTLFLIPFIFMSSAVSWALTLQQTGSTGVEGTVLGNPPSQPATIGIPKSGQIFSATPIIVSGLCPNKTLVEIYDNNVFVGSANCISGSYNLQIDPFVGRNDLIARDYDSLNQAGPDSATVTVFFNPPVLTNGSRISLTTQYASRGAQPGDILSWPITLSGGTSPYALSIDWGDKTEPTLLSVQIAGDVNLQHTYAQSGVYKVTVRATDTADNAAFLQLVAIGNGPVQLAASGTSGTVTIQKTEVLWWPVSLLFALAIFNYWLGQKRQLETIRNRLRKGEPPFA